jgi:hypothetical protein
VFNPLQSQQGSLAAHHREFLLVNPPASRPSRRHLFLLLNQLPDLPNNRPVNRRHRRLHNLPIDQVLSRQSFLLRSHRRSRVQNRVRYQAVNRPLCLLRNRPYCHPVSQVGNHRKDPLQVLRRYRVRSHHAALQGYQLASLVRYQQHSRVQFRQVSQPQFQRHNRVGDPPQTHPASQRLIPAAVLLVNLLVSQRVVQVANQAAHLPRFLQLSPLQDHLANHLQLRRLIRPEVRLASQQVGLRLIRLRSRLANLLEHQHRLHQERLQASPVRHRLFRLLTFQVRSRHLFRPCSRLDRQLLSHLRFPLVTHLVRPAASHLLLLQGTLRVYHRSSLHLNRRRDLLSNPVASQPWFRLLSHLVSQQVSLHLLRADSHLRSRRVTQAVSLRRSRPAFHRVYQLMYPRVSLLANRV